MRRTSGTILLWAGLAGCTGDKAETTPPPTDTADTETTTDTGTTPDTDTAAPDEATPSCTNGEWRAALIDADGQVLDLTETLNAGTPESLVDLILIEPGTLYLCAGQWYISLDIQADITIIGEGIGATILDAAGRGRLIRADDVALSISGLSLVDAYADRENGGALHATNTILSITDTAFIDNAAYDNGGALYLVDSALIASGLHFTSNQANSGGHMYLSGGSAAIDGSQFTTGTAGNMGAAVAAEGALVLITDSVLSGNFSNLVGGAFGLQDSTVDLRRCDLTNNSADDYGGIAYITEDSTLTLTESTTEDNDAGYGGGGVYGDSGTVVSQKSTWDDAVIHLENQDIGSYYIATGTISFTCSLTGCQ